MVHFVCIFSQAVPFLSHKKIEIQTKLHITTAFGFYFFFLPLSGVFPKGRGWNYFLHFLYLFLLLLLKCVLYMKAMHIFDLLYLFLTHMLVMVHIVHIVNLTGFESPRRQPMCMFVKYCLYQIKLWTHLEGIIWLIDVGRPAHCAQCHFMGWESRWNKKEKTS